MDGKTDFPEGVFEFYQLSVRSLRVFADLSGSSNTIGDSIVTPVSNHRTVRSVASLGREDWSRVLISEDAGNRVTTHRLSRLRSGKEMESRMAVWRTEDEDWAHGGGVFQWKEEWSQFGIRSRCGDGMKRMECIIGL
ncbi:hypothetical protein BV898_07785 [Hypsibius exemplaris]|uniref:Uncharacterized protein n=1 Tax=Hypsibius exemplaris TaxID=2072580 RepID=A0A1W0WSM0_HYPEX|nr:hypothetical protein BV898_07785 [Hypsibius exemplaris]